MNRVYLSCDCNCLKVLDLFSCCMLLDLIYFLLLVQLGQWKKAEYLFRSIKVDTRVWTEVVKKLAARKDYKVSMLKCCNYIMIISDIGH